MQAQFKIPFPFSMKFPIFIGMIAIGLYIVVRTSTLHDAYKLLANNQAYTERYSFKLRRKFRKKIDEF